MKLVRGEKLQILKRKKQDFTLKSNMTDFVQNSEEYSKLQINMTS